MTDDADDLQEGLKRAQEKSARQDFESSLAELYEGDGDGPGPDGGPPDAPMGGGPEDRGPEYWAAKGEELAPLVMLTWGGGLTALARGLDADLPEDAVTMESAQNIATAAAPLLEKYVPAMLDKYGLELAFVGVLANETSAAAVAIYRAAMDRAEEKARQERAESAEVTRDLEEEDGGSRFSGLGEDGEV